MEKIALLVTEKEKKSDRGTTENPVCEVVVIQVEGNRRDQQDQGENQVVNYLT